MGKRPDHVKPPAHWTKGPPPPQPDPIDARPGSDEEIGRAHV